MSTSSLCRLSQLHEGETATVDHLNLSGPIRRRLHDLGLIEGTKVRCLYKKRLAGPGRLFDSFYGHCPAQRGHPQHLCPPKPWLWEVMKMPFLKSSFSPLPAADADLTIALAGNPNVGKSSIFNALTGMHQHTGNWPGKTVDLASGSCCHKGVRMRWVDLPGTYSLSADSPEEEAARDYFALNSTMPSW